MRPPSVSQTASAASSRPGTTSTGRCAIVPNAAVSPGISPTPWNATPPEPRERADAAIARSAPAAADHDDGVHALEAERAFQADRIGRRRDDDPALGADGAREQAHDRFDDAVAPRARRGDAHARLTDLDIE